MERRSYLLLQGPVGPFFERLGRRLGARGHRVLRVNFNGGDFAQWRLPGAVSFRGAAAQWPGFVADLVERNAITDLVMFGDCRPRHRVAARILGRLGVRLHVFEEGYFRPDWVTLEPEGVNGYSRLPRDPAFYREAGEGLLRRPWPRSTPIGPALNAMIRCAIAYYAGVTLLRPWFAHHRTHRPHGPLLETVSWLERGCSLRVRHSLASTRQAALLAAPDPFFVLALQLDADTQVRRHSPFAGMSEVIARIVRAFACAAPADTRLVVKNHPLDCGMIDFERVLRHQARAAGVAARVVYLDGGDLPALLERSRGLVVVNSTAGLSAIHSGVPTLVLGKALYDLPGLTHGAGLDPDAKLADFWRCPEAPERNLYRAFRRVVMERSQINGGFYSRHGIERALPVAIARLEAA